MKLIIKIICLIVFFIFVTITLLSFGFSTTRFNEKIINQIEKKVPHSNIKFNNASISLDLFSLSIKVRINNPRITIDDQNILLNSFVIFTDLKSSIQEKYLLKKIKINFKENKISKLKKISFIKNVKAFDEINFLKGTINGSLIIDQFQKNKTSKIFKGEINNIVISVGDDLPLIKKINGKINLTQKKISFTELSGNFGEFDLFSRELNYFFIERFLSGAINLNGRLNSSINLNKIIPKNIANNLEKFDDISGDFAIDANLKVNFNENYTIKKDETTFNLVTKNLKFRFQHSKQYFFDNVNSTINFNNYGKISSEGEFRLNNKKNKFEAIRQNSKKPLNIKLTGVINFKDIFFDKESFLIKNDVKYSSQFSFKNFEQFDINFIFDLKDTELDLELFNFKKKRGDESKLNFKFSKIKNFSKFNNISFTSKNNKINIKYLLFDKKFNIKDIGKSHINLGQKNNFQILKNKNNFIIKGSVVDLSKYLSKKKKNKSQDLKFNLNSNLKIDFKKIYLPGDFLENYENFMQIENGKIVKLNSSANFENFTSFSHKVLKSNKGNKLMIISSDKAKPFLSNYEFLEGLKGGTLYVQREYLSDNLSVTEVKVENFYLKKMPVLTKILSIASLTGALDILEGKGIFFKEAYLKYELNNNELKILDCYGTGPSLGFVLEGRVGENKFTSLNGSLAPANTINNIVREIPVVGKILTGKKGDGIFGASFKIKGNDKLQVEVNPIKTITPRFIQRFLKVLKK